MRRETVIAGLICLNLGLLAGLAYVWKGRANVAGGNPRTNAVPSSVDGPSKFVTRTIHLPADQPENPTRFTWRALESSEFPQYIANLRAVGCPEQTIQDIIIAEVNKLYAGKEAALRLRPEHLKPWEVFAVSTRATVERERKLRQLQREKRNLLKELLGIDVPIELANSSSGGVASREARFEKAFDKLPEGKRELVRTIQESYWDRMEALNERTKGFWEQQDHDEQRRLKLEYRNSLANALTADELLDFDMATSSTGSRLRSELTAFNATEQEMRDIFKVRWKLDDEFSPLNSIDASDPDAGRKRAEARQLMENEMKAVLGEQRYAEYQRSRDFQFRNLSRLTQEHGLPAETAVKAYDVQRVAREESNRLRQNAEITREQRDDLLRQMQAELDAVMGQLLGKQAYDQFRDAYGGTRIYFDRSSNVGGRPTPAPTVAPGTVILAP